MRRRFISVNDAVTPSRIQLCPRAGGFGDNRRDWPEIAIQFHFEGALFRRGQVIKMLQFCGVRLLPGRIRLDLPPVSNLRRGIGHGDARAAGSGEIGALIIGCPKVPARNALWRRPTCTVR